MFKRIYNFSAGPCTLPLEVLEQAQLEMLDWRGSGMSVMEMSHRGKEFMSIYRRAEKDIRELLRVPPNYKILFYQGGATLMFASIPMNFLRGKTQADYVVTGNWSDKAAQEAAKYCTVKRIVDTKRTKYTTIPEPSTWRVNPDSAYVHYCGNETIFGVEFHDIPNVGDVPLICDMSSEFLSKPVDVSKFACVYGGAQKNAGIAGLSIAIVREDFLGKILPCTPIYLNFQLAAKNDSMYNTPPCYSIYIAGLFFDWMKRNGGLEGMKVLAERKSKMIYDLIDASNGFYKCPVDRNCRSKMNIPFRIMGGKKFEEKFNKEATKLGMVQLKGHRSVGGMRASLYNGMTVEGAEALAAFMVKFMKENRAAAEEAMKPKPKL